MSNNNFGIPVNVEQKSVSTSLNNVNQKLNSHLPDSVLQQRLALQQRLRQQQQQNFEQQIFQLLTTLNRKPKRLYQFAEDNDAILKKYEQFKPSFEFHIYENNYKICAPTNTRLQHNQKAPQGTSDGLILNKNNETLREFLEYVARGMIPEAIMEVLRDCNIQFYEGCLILQVYDHTTTVDIKQTQISTDNHKQKHTADGHALVDNIISNKDTESKIDSNNILGESNNKGKDECVTTFKRPRMYRTLLRPNNLTHYYDMLSYADHTRFSDSIYQQLESEILSLTRRNLRLDTPLNPYEQKDKLDDDEFLLPHYDETTQTFFHNHREMCKNECSKGEIGHIEQHEELPQHNSAYEQLMLIMSERTITTTTATLAASLAKKAEYTSNELLQKDIQKNISHENSNSIGELNTNSVAVAAVGSTVNSENNQFSRLKFVEQWRLNKEKRTQQNVNANVSSANYNQRISISSPMVVQQMKQQQILHQQQHQTDTTVNKRPIGEDLKSKPKRQRKNIKKPNISTAAPIATPSPIVKKKVNKKKIDQ